jgi:hypothetical protein
VSTRVPGDRVVADLGGRDPVGGVQVPDRLGVPSAFGLGVAAGEVQVQPAAPSRGHRRDGVGVESLGMAGTVPAFHGDRQRPRRDIGRAEVPLQGIALPGGVREVCRLGQVSLGITGALLAAGELCREQVSHSECFRRAYIPPGGIGFRLEGRSHLGEDSGGGTAGAQAAERTSTG